MLVVYSTDSAAFQPQRSNPLAIPELHESGHHRSNKRDGVGRRSLQTASVLGQKTSKRTNSGFL